MHVVFPNSLRQRDSSRCLQSREETKLQFSDKPMHCWTGWCASREINELQRGCFELIEGANQTSGALHWLQILRGVTDLGILWKGQFCGYLRIKLTWRRGKSKFVRPGVEGHTVKTFQLSINTFCEQSTEVVFFWWCCGCNLGSCPCLASASDHWASFPVQSCY